MATLLRVTWARLRDHFRRDDLDRELEEELAAHLAMAEEDKIRQGMTRRQARRAARVELGGLTQLREASREARGLPWLDNLWLDVKLGLRMLRKSWGLTLVGGLAMTIAIGIGAVVFTFLDVVLSDKLPLSEGERVVAIRTWDAKASRSRETPWSDFERWRDQLRSLEDAGVFRTVERNLLMVDAAGNSGGTRAEPISIAEMTASGFRLARVAPLLGRPLTEDDERGTAPPVVVIGYDVWQSRFAADPDVLGRTVRLGDTIHTVVGVMPEGFAFPVNHRFWTSPRPVRPDLPHERGSFVAVFARLVPGVTLESARAELDTLGLLSTAVSEEGGEELQPRIGPYAFALTVDNTANEVWWMTRIALFFVGLMLVPPCANIAILVYARTVTRQEEFAARYVLGASRGRIVAQLFVEVLLLAMGAAGIALLLARGLTHRLELSSRGEAPFWMDFTVSVKTILFVAGLAVLGAAIAGLLPALKATGRQMQSGLHALGQRTGMKLGATWTALVVAQVAFSAAALPLAVELGWGTIRTGVLGPGFAAEQFLTARLETDRAQGTDFGALQAELVRRLEAEPGVGGVTLSTAVPGDEPWANAEAEGNPIEDLGLFADELIRFNHVDVDFFDVFGVPVLTGRAFNAGDLGSTEVGAATQGRHVVIVNRTFAKKLLGDENPLGHRIRYYDSSVPAAESTWYEIVGVVADLPANDNQGTMYHPIAFGQAGSASLALRLTDTPVAVADRLRRVTTALDPNLRLHEVLPLDEIYRAQDVGNNVGATTLALVTLSVLLLSVAGIYALMSFTVNQRKREIGIRAALGAPPRRILATIFRRALGQVGVGAALGLLVALLIDYYLPIEHVGGWNVPGVVPLAALAMAEIGLLAVAGPARRGLKIDPIEELREG